MSTSVVMRLSKLKHMADAGYACTKKHDTNTAGVYSLPKLYFPEKTWLIARNRGLSHLRK